jgi:ADP-ribose pyrophosphatase YjhB (NUDIX family)
LVWLGQVDVEPPGGDRYWHHVVRLRKAAVLALVDGEEPAVAVTRELAEETGYRARRVEHLVGFQPIAALPLLLMRH